ncbi:hypothetical protein DNU06_00920 [Putridiphycobacter roseus]|uniref:HTH cro/C1-type domain-containing protein n=1 Tax=Putridiphycobacter roseus TaxID=2219161 RepID=A0A2W1N2B1_9FLAO|nr:helix-turn-helix domain-containing protein [Putridiphycobacter roseus]PZE18427.1 hypothetical protein DNU06_00920 [Putridiphycobacter roseus]
MIGENLKFLRKNKKISQEELANELGLTRSSYSGYENGVAEPNVQNLLKFSQFYGVPVDVLIKKDLPSLGVEKWHELSQGVHVDLEGKKLRILATTVNEDDNENIELVSEKASAGYTAGYSDPEFISVLPTFQLPFLKKDRKYRTFPIKGDSMPPVSDGSYVVGEYVENWRNLKSGYPYIVVTQNEGVVFKIVHNRLDDAQSFQLCSTNPFYEPYEVHANEVVEIWKFVNYICHDIPSVSFKESELTKAILGLQADVKHIRNTYIPKND